MDNHSLMVFTGNANPNLAKKVTDHLNIKLGKANVGTFSDGETMVELLENVRGKDVFILQSTSMPTNDHLMEIMVMVDALKRSLPLTFSNNSTIVSPSLNVPTLAFPSLILR